MMLVYNTPNARMDMLLQFQTSPFLIKADLAG